jgi:hypothetical protein
LKTTRFRPQKTLIIATIEEALVKYYQYKDLITETNSGKIVTEGPFWFTSNRLASLRK